MTAAEMRPHCCCGATEAPRTRPPPRTATWRPAAAAAAVSGRSPCGGAGREASAGRHRQPPRWSRAPARPPQEPPPSSSQLRPAREVQRCRDSCFARRWKLPRRRPRAGVRLRRLRLRRRARAGSTPRPCATPPCRASASPCGSGTT